MTDEQPSEELLYELRMFTHIQAILGNAVIKACEAPVAKEVLDFLEKQIVPRQKLADAAKAAATATPPPVPAETSVAA